MTTRTLAARPSRLGALTLAGLAATLALGGCAVASPTQTDLPATLSDGINVDVAPHVLLRSLVIVTAGKGEPGRVSAQVVNNRLVPVDLAFAAAEGQKSKITIPARTSADLASPDMAVTLPTVPVGPGELTPLTVTLEGATDVFNVPVLAPKSFYSEVTPKAEPSPTSLPAEPSPTPTS